MILRFILLSHIVAISVYGLLDDSHVESFRSARVERRDPGVLMRQHSTHRIPGRSYSSQQEFSESQRYVNGQPVYENRHERRYENGRLVHQDGFERGNPHASRESVSRVNPRMRLRSGIDGNTGRRHGRVEHSRSSWQQSSSGRTGGNLDSSSINCESCSGADYLQQGVSAISIPSTSTGVHSREERVQEQHFRNGNPVYRRNEERRFENNDLVHEDIDEDGQRIGVQPENSPTPLNRRVSQRIGQSGISYRPTYSRNTGRPSPPVPSMSASMRNSSILTRTNERHRINNRPTHRSNYNPSHSRTSSSSSARTVSVREREEASVVPSAQHLGRSRPYMPEQNNRQPQYVYRPTNSNIADRNSQSVTSPSNHHRYNTYENSSSNANDRYVDYNNDDQPVAPVVHVPYNSSPYSGRPYQPSSFSTYSNWSTWRENNNGDVSAENSNEVTSSSTPIRIIYPENTLPDRRYRTETITTPSPSIRHSSQSESQYSSSSSLSQSSDTSQHNIENNVNNNDDRQRATLRVRPNSTIGLSLTINPHRESIYNVRQHNSSLSVDDYSRHDIDPRNGENSLKYGDRYAGTIHQPLTGHDVMPGSFSLASYQNQTTRTLAQPTIRSYRVETKTSRRYRNGRIESEIKHYKYFHNGVLVHENQTETSRDELESAGTDVSALDLSSQDLEAYGVLHTDIIPTSHSQKYERREEYEYKNNVPVYHMLHERKYQDGQLVDENHDEQDEEDLRDMLATTRNGVPVPSIDTSITPSRSEYHSQNRHQISRYDNTRNYVLQPGGIEEPVQPSASIVTNEIVAHERENDVRTHHVRNEEINRNVYPIGDAPLEASTEEEKRYGYRDALTDLMTGRNLATARDHTGNYVRTYSAPGSNSEYQRNEPSHVQTIETAESNRDSYGQRSGSEHNHQGHYGQSANTEQSTSSLNTRLVGDSSLNSRHRTNLIGGREIDSLDDLREAIRGRDSQSQSLFAGSSQDSEKRNGHFNAFANFDITSGTGSPYGQAVSHRTQSEREEHYENGNLLRGREAEREWRDGQLLKNDERNYRGHGQPLTSSITSPGLVSQTAFQTTGGSGGHFGATASFSAQTVPVAQGTSFSSRSEHAVDERFENGQLVTGREDNRQWENDQLLRDDRRYYGQNERARATTRSGASRNPFASRLGLSGRNCVSMTC